VRPLALVLLLGLLASPQPLRPAALAQGKLIVSAAVSLTDVMEALGPIYTKGGGAPVTFNFAASNVLARQIANGAPVDLFISADEAQMDIAAAAGAIDAATRVRLLGNTLVVIHRRALAGTAGGEARAIDALRHPRYRRIAIGDPAAVPAGVYAKRLLHKDGLWDVLQSKLVPVVSVRAALAAVGTGAADAGFVYASDAHAYRGGDIAILHAWPSNEPGIVYPAALVKSSRRRDEAARFLAFLCGADAAAVFERHRFTPLRCT
jgi:molybdate transport system substrate-binding protein